MLKLTTKSILAACVLALAATVTCFAPAARAAVVGSREHAVAPGNEAGVLASAVRGSLAPDVSTAPHDDSGDGGDGGDTDDGGDDGSD